MQLDNRGFILVATLWILAAMTLAASFFSLWIQRTLEIAQAMSADLQGEIDMESTRSIVFFLLGTQRFTIAGMTVPVEMLPKPETTDAGQDKLVVKEVSAFEMADRSVLPTGNEMTLDDHPYRGYGKAFFALQDERGLMPLNALSVYDLTRFLSLLGVEEELCQPLADKFLDYVDVDDFHRLNGAESYHYKQRNLLPPANRFLLNPMEAEQIIDWAEQRTLWKNYRFGQLSNTVLGDFPNFNTAPTLVLQSFYGIDKHGAEQVVKLRREIPFNSLATVSQVTGINFTFDPFYANFFAATYLRLTLWYKGWHRIRQVHFKLTSSAPKRKPWRIDKVVELNTLPQYTEILPDDAQTRLFTSTFSASSH